MCCVCVCRANLPIVRVIVTGKPLPPLRGSLGRISAGRLRLSQIAPVYLAQGSEEVVLEMWRSAEAASECRAMQEGLPVYDAGEKRRMAWCCMAYRGRGWDDGDPQPPGLFQTCAPWRLPGCASPPQRPACQPFSRLATQECTETCPPQVTGWSKSQAGGIGETGTLGAPHTWCAGGWCGMRPAPGQKTASGERPS